MAKSVDNPPSAYYLMDSMRSIGYSFNSAVADIIDNSISASAQNIWIDVSPDPADIYLVFLDDGHGMDQAELISAMRYGSKSKAGDREEMDLGRFGLGLKSASLSQCKKLTVVSKKKGALAAACWDLDYIAANGNGWSLLLLDEKEILNLPCVDRLLEQKEGTLVIWQDFDILRQVYDGREHHGLIESIETARDYLGLIFHRFLSGVNKLNLYLNDEKIEPFDPFLEGNKKTEIGKTSDLTICDSAGINRHISVTPYLLPYLKDLTDDDKRKLGGVERIRSMQGFYVYRNNRLIIFGTWFHMSYRQELAKYARIRVDIPSSLDEIWKIDIKKQSAELPPSIKHQLAKLVESSKFSSRKKSEHRLTLKNGDKEGLWLKHVDRDQKATYRVNREAPFIKALLQSFEPAELNKVNMIINAIEKTIPYQDMYTDEANDNISRVLESEDKASLIADGYQMFLLFVKLGVGTIDEIIAKICSIEPFRQYEWFNEALRKEVSTNAK